jgi:fatty acyl-CoA reductase
MVVNAILVAIVAHANHPSVTIYHVGSSVRRPLTYKNLQEFGFRHFSVKPWINKDGKPVKVGKVTVFSNMDYFRRFMFVRYLLMLKVNFYILSQFYPCFFKKCKLKLRSQTFI